MKIVIFVAFALALALAATADNDDVLKVTACTTNGQRIVTKDTYTRAGATNLIVKTIFRGDENKTYRIQNVYRNGKLVMDIWDMNDGLTISVKAQNDCIAGTHFTTNGILTEVNLMDTNIVMLDHFTVTNNVLHPISAREIRKANEVTVDVKAFFDPSNIKTNTPESFAAQAAAIRKKHEKD